MKRSENDIPVEITKPNPIADNTPGKCKVMRTYGVPLTLRYAVTSPDGATIAAFNSRKDAEAYVQFVDAEVEKARKRRRGDAPDGYIQLEFVFIR